MSYMLFKAPFSSFLPGCQLRAPPGKAASPSEWKVLTNTLMKWGSRRRGDKQANNQQARLAARHNNKNYFNTKKRRAKWSDYTNSFKLKCFQNGSHANSGRKQPANRMKGLGTQALPDGIKLDQLCLHRFPLYIHTYAKTPDVSCRGGAIERRQSQTFAANKLQLHWRLELKLIQKIVQKEINFFKLFWKNYKNLKAQNSRMYDEFLPSARIS